MSDPKPSAATIDETFLRELNNTQQQLESVREQLMESQRLATIGTIASVIAHEFNNLLTPMTNYTQMALRGIEAGQPDMELIIKALQKSFAGATKAGKICKSMLGLAKGESEFGRVEVQKLVDEVLSVMARDPQKDGIALRVFIAPGLSVQGDPVQLEQVLLNLLINARQALLGSGSGKSITIKAGEPEAGEVKIQVIDDGPGIPGKLITKIFEPFFTTKGTVKKGEQKGTGLGLAICREIMEHHHGRIEVTSEVGRGTTFTVVLPGEN